MVDEMRVLYIAHYFLPNMSATVTTQEIIRMLLQNGHKVALISPSTYVADDLSAYQHCDGLKVIRAFTAIPKHMAQRSKLASMLTATLAYISVFVTGLRFSKTDGSIDAIIVQYHPFHLASLTSYLLSVIIKTPLIVKIHDIVPGSPAKKKLEVAYGVTLSKVNNMALVHASAVLSHSKEVSKILVQLFGVEAGKIEVFPNTVDLNRFSSAENADQLRTRLGLDEKKVVLFLGSAFENKGLDVLLRALHIIEDERVILVVVGPRDKRYMELARRLHINHRVVFLGEVDHRFVPRHIHMADVCIGSLIARLMWYGLIPRKVIECMACGKPVIVARGAVPKDLVEDGVSGVFVDSANEVEVASKIVSLMNDSGLRRVIGAEARRVIAERYSTGKLADKLDKILKHSTLRVRD